MPKKRQSKTAVKSVSVRFHPVDLALVKKAAKANNRSLQKYAVLRLVECAKKTLQMSLPIEP